MSRRALLVFIALSVAWGIPYLLIKVAVDELSPIVLVFTRTALGALVMLPLALAKGWLQPVLRRWRLLLVFAAAEVTVPWLLLSRAEQHLSSSLSGLLVAAVPLAAIGVAMLLGSHQRLGGQGRAGLVVGIVGVGLLVGVDVEGSQWSAVAEMVGVVLCYALGATLLDRWFSDVPGPGVVAAALSVSALTYLPFAVPVLPSHLPSARVVGSMAVLVGVCTVGAFLLLITLVREIGPVRATTITYINPAVAVLAGVLVLGEPLTVGTVGGFALVIAGSYLVNRGRRPQQRLDEAAPVPAPVPEGSAPLPAAGG